MAKIAPTLGVLRGSAGDSPAGFAMRSKGAAANQDASNESSTDPDDAAAAAEATNPAQTTVFIDTGYKKNSALRKGGGGGGAAFPEVCCCLLLSAPSCRQRLQPNEDEGDVSSGRASLQNEQCSNQSNPLLQLGDCDLPPSPSLPAPFIFIFNEFDDRVRACVMYKELHPHRR